MAEIGDNNPPEGSALELALTERHAALLDEAAALELDAGLLPEDVTSDADVAAITAWGVRAKALAAKLKSTQEDVKAPYLADIRTVDTFFLRRRDHITAKALDEAKRITAYLQAKREAEEARRREELAAQRLAQEEARQRAAAEAEAARAAEREAEAARQRIIDATNAEARQIAQQELQAANEAKRLTDAAAEQAEKDAAAAGRAGDRMERKVETGRLERVGAEGGRAALKKTWKWRYVTGKEPELAGDPRDLEGRIALIASLGPLAAFLPSKEIDAALDRAAKAPNQPTVPGIEFYQAEEADIRGTRSR